MSSAALGLSAGFRQEPVEHRTRRHIANQPLGRRAADSSGDHPIQLAGVDHPRHHPLGHVVLDERARQGLREPACQHRIGGPFDLALQPLARRGGHASHP